MFLETGVGNKEGFSSSEAVEPAWFELSGAVEPLHMGSMACVEEVVIVPMNFSLQI